MVWFTQYHCSIFTALTHSVFYLTIKCLMAETMLDVHPTPFSFLPRHTDRLHFPAFLVVRRTPVTVCMLSCFSSVWLLWDPMDCSLPGSSVHGILQTRILEWVAISSSRGSSPPRDWTCVSYIYVHWQAPPPGKPYDWVMTNGMWAEVIEFSLSPGLKSFLLILHTLSSFAHYLGAESLVEGPRPLGDDGVTG